jgi:two-component system chemotaxis response regulator CheY
MKAEERRMFDGAPADETIKLEDLRVLVVEDSHEALMVIKNMLQDFGINQVFTAKDGKQALEFLGEWDNLVDVILCDWNMPNITGLQLLQQLRTVDPDIPFLMITGVADMVSVLEAKSLGVTSYIRKPFSKDELLSKLQVVVRLLAHRA